MRVPRDVYAALYGPTVGDRVRFADTSLLLEVEEDLITYGDEVVFGGGKVIRDGQGQSQRSRGDGVPDLVNTNAIVLDVAGVVKGDVGVKDGRIVGIGKAGNPDIQDGVTPGLAIGASTEILAGEGKILTAGGIDAHIHFISPQQAWEALYSGITTMIGGGTGPTTGTKATTTTPGAWALHRMLEAAEGFPLNFGYLGKGNASQPDPLREQLLAGACGLKLHEDCGTTPSTIDTALTVAGEFDVQVAIHTDTLNESGFVETTIDAFAGRTIHTYHSEGAGGGHAPDIMRVVGFPNVLPSSTNPTMPYTRNTLDEHLDMLMVCHHLNPRAPEDVAFAESRIRPETMAAEDVLHDIGAISMMASDSQAMGRVGEVISRTWQTAHKMKVERGPLPEDSERNDNTRIRRYLAKYTINPAIAQGVSEHVGSISEGKLADLVLWDPAFFGVKPDTIIKGGMIVGAIMGNPNASIPTPEPVTGCPARGDEAQAPPRPPHPGHRQGGHGAERRPPRSQNRPRQVHRHRQRRAYEKRAGGDLALGSALLPLLVMDALASLRLQQLFDSQFPIGGFAYSNGIETYAQRGTVVAELPALLMAGLQMGWGRVDLAASVLAHDAAPDQEQLAEIAECVNAVKLVSGPREASLQMGRRAKQMVQRLHPACSLDVAPPHHAVVMGAAGSALGIPKHQLALALAQQTLTGSLAAATRCMRLSPGRAQQILTGLQPSLIETVETALSASLDTLYSCTPALDIRANQQATLYSRLFQS